MTNTLSPKGAQFMRLHEGFRANWYLDPVGIPTIGIGFTWRSSAFRKWWARNKPGVKFARGASMTRAEAEDALIYLCEQEYGKAVNDFYGKKLKQHVFDGSVSPVYNLGPGSLQWKWAAAAKRGDLKEAANRLRVTGTTARGRTLPGLVRRRKEEALLLEKGIYVGVDTSHGSEPVDAMSDGMLERGEAGPAVAALIRDLAALGFYDGVMDDRYGFGTEAAVMELQETHSIDRDGVAGPQTLALIKELLSDSAEPPAPATPAEEEKSPGLLAILFGIIFGGKG